MVAINSQFLLLLLLATTTLFLYTTTAATVSEIHPLLGGYQDIPVDPYVEDLARFAIKEHNKQKNDHLIYSTTPKAERQVVNGDNYRLQISAYRDHEKPNNYEAVVYVPLGSGAKNLTSFKTLPPAIITPGPRGGQYIPIPNARNNPQVQELGKFAVQEYNDKFNIDGPLTFSEVEAAEYQIVQGTNYHLLLIASRKNEPAKGRFDVFVYESLSGVKTLTSFKRQLLKAR